MAGKNILHYPRLDTVLMVEDTIRKMNKYPLRKELWENLPKQVQYQTFKLILEYLERSNKITFTKDNKIMWIGSNKKLDDLIKKGKEYWCSRLLAQKSLTKNFKN